MELEATEQRILDAAEELLYGRGIQSVGMDAIRTASG
ncbi:TetR/AcrR family transcriptional regulator, partial [Streptomyces sp. MCAF7]